MDVNLSPMQYKKLKSVNKDIIDDIGALTIPL